MTTADHLPELIEPPHLMTRERWARIQAATPVRSEAHKKLSQALEDCRKRQQK